MAPDSVGDGDQRPRRRRRRLVKLGCSSRVTRSSRKQELSGSSEGKKGKEKVMKLGCSSSSRVTRSSRKQELSGSSEGKKGKEKVMKDDYALGYRYPRLSIDGKLVVSSSSDDDDDDYHRKMTPAEIEIYNKQVLETGGFDVDVPPEVDNCGVIHPDLDFDKKPLKFEKVKRCSRKAIDVYNKKHKAKYEFTRVLKLGSMMVDGYVHYITFEAKAEGAAPMCFQAIVYAGITEDDIEVHLCRPRPSS